MNENEKKKIQSATFEGILKQSEEKKEC